MDMANMIASMLFGAVGFVAFLYGKRQMLPKTMVIGGLLMAYPYFITNTLAVYLIGASLTGALFLFRE